MFGRTQLGLHFSHRERRPRPSPTAVRLVVVPFVGPYFRIRAEQRFARVVKTAGKPEARWLIRDRTVTSISERSSGSLSRFLFLTGPGIISK